MRVADDKKNPLGPIGDQVCRNVERLRTARSMSKKALSDATGKVGRAIPPLGISRIETGERRVDADDLIALALALNVSPLTLLLPPSAGAEPVALTTNQQVTTNTAWQWATGSRTASDWEPGGVVPEAGPGVDPAGNVEALEREMEFGRRQAEYKVLAEPEQWRRGADQEAVRVVRNLEGVIVDLVAPEPGVDRATLRARFRMARRRHAQLGFELDAIEDRLPAVHPGFESTEAQAEKEGEFLRKARAQSEARADLRHGQPTSADPDES